MVGAFDVFGEEINLSWLINMETGHTLNIRRQFVSSLSFANYFNPHKLRYDFKYLSESNGGSF